MQIYRINPHVVAFYFGGDTEPDNPNLKVQVEDNWEIGACDGLGVASYVVHNGPQAIVYDTLCSPQQADLIKAYLGKELGITKFTVVLSHWHLDHVGGNELYKQSNIVACRKTREHLLEHKDEIEAGTLWGEPVIKPLRLPDLVFEQKLSIFLDDLEVQLFNFHIHSDDSVCAYIPKYKILLPGDMLEDTAPFITNPEAIPVHLNNYEQLRAMDIDKILPNHGRSAVIKSGGYSKELIDSVTFYLTALYGQLEKQPDSRVAELQTFMAEYLDKGIIYYWEPYEAVHNNNTERVREFFTGKWQDDGRLL